MSHIQKMANGKYKARYNEPDGRERSRTFVKKGQAEAFLAEKDYELLAGTYLDPSKGKKLFRDHANEWQSLQMHRITTTDQVDRILRRQILPSFGAQPLDRITRSQVQSWVKELQGTLGPETIGTVFRWFSCMMKSAVDTGLLRDSPCNGVKPPKTNKVPILPIRTDAILKLVEEIPDRFKALVTFAATTGLRQGEVFGVPLQNVDFVNQTVRVTQQVIWIAGTGPLIGPPKTKASMRSVPLAAITLDHLQNHIDQFGIGEEDLIFSFDDGKKIPRNRFNDRIWVPARKRAGLGKEVVFHALRHHYASLLIYSGESVKSVQSYMGHATASETLDRYGHLWPESHDSTRNAVQSAFSGLTACGRPGRTRPMHSPRSDVGWWRVGRYAGFCLRCLRTGGGHPSARTVTCPL